MKDGRARIINKSGTVFKGIYNNNHHEKGVIIDKNGELIKGTYKDN